jgi:hypothetical protein
VGSGSLDDDGEDRLYDDDDDDDDDGLAGTDKEGGSRLTIGLTGECAL